MILAWIVLSFAIGILSMEKDLGFWGGFLISIVLSPLIGLIIYLVSGKKKPVEPSEIEKLKAEIELLKNK
jgi:hypothetical protein